SHENHPGRTHWRFSSSGNLGPQGCSCLSWHRVLRTHQCLSHTNPLMESTVAPPINPNPHGLFALQLGWKSPIEGSNVGISLTIARGCSSQLRYDHPRES